MFCLQCGAEAPARAVLCPTCGHDLGRSSADLRSSLALADAPLASSVSLPGPAIAGALPSIRAGDLDRPGLPQDTPGRVLLVVLLAMAVDLFLPWSVAVGQHYTLPQTAGFAIVVLLLLAGLPLMHPRLRRNTISAAFPILIGGICLGVGVTYWVNLTQSQVIQPFGGSTISEVPLSSRSVIFGAFTPGPDFGLFGFLIGAAALAVLGYYLLLEAARAPFQELARQQAPVETGQSVGSGPAAVSTTEPAQRSRLPKRVLPKQRTTCSEIPSPLKSRPLKSRFPVATPGPVRWSPQPLCVPR